MAHEGTLSVDSSERWVTHRIIKWSMYGINAFPILDFALRHAPHLHPIGSIWDKVMFLVLLVMAIVRYLAGYRPKWFMWKKIGLWYILFCVALTVIGLYQPTIAVEGLRFDIFYLLFAYLIPFVVQPEDAESFLHVGAIFAILIAMHGIYQFIMKAPYPANWNDTGEVVRSRVYSVFGSPNELADYMDLMTPIVLGLGIYAEQAWRRWTYGIGAFLCAIALVLSYTRGAWLGLAAAAFLVGALCDRRMLLAVVVVGVLSYFLPPVRHRFSDLFTHTYFVKAAAGGRIERWLTAFNTMAPNPLVGTGIGRYGGAVATHLGIQYADGYYFKLLGESGLVGLTLFLSMQISFVRDLMRLARPLMRGKTHYVFLGAFVGLIAVLVHNVTEDAFEFGPSVVSYYTYGTLFFLWAQHLKTRQESSPSNKQE